MNEWVIHSFTHLFIHSFIQSINQSAGWSAPVCELMNQQVSQWFSEQLSHYTSFVTFCKSNQSIILIKSVNQQISQWFSESVGQSVGQLVCVSIDHIKDYQLLNQSFNETNRLNVVPKLHNTMTDGSSIHCLGLWYGCATGFTRTDFVSHT